MNFPAASSAATFRVPRRGDLRCASVRRPRSDDRGQQCQEWAVPRREAPASRICCQAAC